MLEREVLSEKISLERGSRTKKESLKWIPKLENRWFQEQNAQQTSRQESMKKNIQKSAEFRMISTRERGDPSVVKEMSGKVGRSQTIVEFLGRLNFIL